MEVRRIVVVVLHLHGYAEEPANLRHKKILMSVRSQAKMACDEAVIYSEQRIVASREPQPKN